MGEVEREPKWFSVAVYECDQGYGGPEEGGWWFATGTLSNEVAPIICHSREEVKEAIQKLEKVIKDEDLNAGRYPPSSVLCNGYYQVCVHDESLPAHFPERRPHYE